MLIILLLSKYAYTLFCAVHMWLVMFYCISFFIAATTRVSAQAMSSDSIKVSWTPAPTASSVSVTYYINASSSTYQTVRRTVTDPDREVVISGLHPFAEYHITVQAGNPGGLSEPMGRSAATLTAGVYFVIYILSSAVEMNAYIYYMQTTGCTLVLVVSEDV